MKENDVARTNRQRESWVDQHMGRTSVETAKRLLETEQPRPPADAPLLHLRGVPARCVAGGASNFWIIGSPAGEPVLSGDYPLIGMSPTAYFVQAPEFNLLPYAIRKDQLTPDNHNIDGNISALVAKMHDVYG